METEVNKKIHYDNIDLLKFIANIVVIFYHFNHLNINFIENNNFVSYMNYFFMGLLSTCVPIFFFVNGALLLNKNELNIKNHISKTLNIIILVFVWSFITIFILMFATDKQLTILQIVKAVLRTGIEGWTNHLWFLKAIVVIYIFYPLIFVAQKTEKEYVYFFLCCVIILTFGNTLLIFLLTIYKFITSSSHNLIAYKNFFGGFHAFVGTEGYSIGYFIIGGLLFSIKEKLNIAKFKVIALVSIPISLFLLFGFGYIASLYQNQIWGIVWFGYDSVFTLLNVIAIFILTTNYKHVGKFGTLISLVGRNTFGIYLVHMIFGKIIDPYYKNLILSHTILSDLGFSLFILIISLYLVLLLKKIPIVKYLFSI